MVNLITDRTQMHVDRLKLLSSKGWNKLTASEQNEYSTYAAKGAYNYTDLNRVESAVAEIAEIIGLNLSTKTNWTRWDNPTQSEMTRYLGNVAKIRERYASVPNLPSLPRSMSNLDYVGANNIESVLLRVYERIESCVQSGEIYSGEV